MPVISKGLRGSGRKRAVRAHRLLLYVSALDLYMAGRVSLTYVIERAQKCLQCGLRTKV